MAVKRKVKAKARPKRRKAPAKRPAVRRKITPRARKAVRKAPARRPARKARPAARVSVPRPPSAPERPVPGERVGVVTHYYGEPRVAVVKLDAGASLRVGDTIHVQGHTSDFTQRVDSLQVEHAAVEEVGPNDDFGLKVVEHAREHDVVYKLR